MTLSQAELEATAATLARRPGHEQVRVRICDILERHFEVGYDAVDHERRIEHVGRIDALFGSTVFEFKRDLRREAEDAERQLHRYLIDRESATGRRYAGIATDGNDFRAYEIRSDRLCQIGAYRVEATNANGLLVWLESVIGIGADLEPTAETIRRELGKESAAFARATGVLEAAWSRLATDSEAALKRRLWSELITAVYGRSQDSDELWFQHTFLTIIAKAFAHAVLRVTPDDAEDLLQGRQFRDLAIGGLIEGDFFDWVLKDEEAADLVMRLDRHVRRFRIDRVELDVLKIVYESLIDPAQRHDLGEYYTPDWLADWICARHVDAPASQKVLDPACGSGSFLFHAVRHHVAAARAEGVPEGELAQSAAAHVFGLDVHPVAVLVARVTYLLALGADLLERRTTAVDVPVYLGDALQWSVRGGDLFEETLEIHVPESGGHGEAVLRFPVAVCRDPGVFDDIIRLMLEDGDAGRPTQAFVEQLSQDDRIAAADRAVLADAYATLARLQAEGRNHVWGYVARNLSRPLWLSQTIAFDRLIGNPPWLSLRYMEAGLQRRVRDAMKAANLWVGGQHATHQDLSLLFFERTVRHYLRRGGRIAFVMPLAAMTRGYAEKFRTGAFPQGKVQFREAWTFDDRVFPLFPVPSCVLFAEREAPAQGLPETVTGFAGILPDRNVPADIAERRLRQAEEAAPAVATFQAATPYRSAFRQGATLVPRMLCYVVRRETGLGGPRVPVESRRSTQENEPWKSLPSVRGAVEREFIRPALLGESIAPYRLLAEPEAVIPWDGDVMDAQMARRRGHRGLASWLDVAESLWHEHSSQSMRFIEQIDYYGKLSSQFPQSRYRIIYTKAGTIPAAHLLRTADAIVDHKLYWASVDHKEEAYYLVAFLNSETLRASAQHLQSRGQWGARDFDKVFFSLPIPKFSFNNDLHIRLSEAAVEAERISNLVDLEAVTRFVDARRRIRTALAEDGIAGEIDDLVRQLLFGE